MALTALIILSIGFAVTHLGLSHGPIRRGLVDKLGPWPFKGVYSLVAFATLGGAIWIYSGHRDLGRLLWITPGWVYPLIYLLMLLAFLLLVLAVANPSPSGMAPAAMEARGVLRISRHPMNMGIAAFGLAHVLANGYLGDAVFFGAIFAAGFFGAYHQDRRKAVEKGEPYREFQQATSILPFAAVVTGKTRLSIKEFSFPLAVIAVAAFLAVMFFHRRLFGISPF